MNSTSFLTGSGLEHLEGIRFQTFQLLPEMLFSSSATTFGGGLFDDNDEEATGNASVTTVSSVKLPPILGSISQRLLQSLGHHGQVRVPLYAVIFVLAVLGNVLVIVTLAQNRAMRTVTNLFLLNLSVSDLLLAVLCMPFTLIPTLLQDFIFGSAMCVLIRYMQGVSVGVSVFTLVTISMERYFAICRPLTSLRWQTRRHAYKTICLVWIVALIVMIPTAVYHRLLRMPNGAHKCAEIWNDLVLEKVYTIFLDVILLVLPLWMMVIAYGRIAVTLFRGFRRLNDGRTAQQLRAMTSSSSGDNGNHVTTSAAVHGGDIDDTVSGPNSSSKRRLCARRGPAVIPLRGTRFGRRSSNNVAGSGSTSSRHFGMPPRGDSDSASSSCSGGGCSNNASRMRAKKRSVQMLSAVVIEFFVCWTPMYVLQTWSVFDYNSAVERVSSTVMNYIHLLAFVSSCCNPVTYCFMSAKFRQGFVAAFRCCCCFWRHGSGIRGPIASTLSMRRTGMGSQRGVVGVWTGGGGGVRGDSVCPGVRSCCRGEGDADDGGRLSPDAAGALVDAEEEGKRRVRRGVRPTSFSMSTITTGPRSTRIINVDVTHF